MTSKLKIYIDKSPRIGGFTGLEHLSSTKNRRGLVSQFLKIFNSYKRQNISKKYIMSLPSINPYTTLKNIAFSPLIKGG
jgi:hypothetical protein